MSILELRCQTRDGDSVRVNIPSSAFAASRGLSALPSIQVVVPTPGCEECGHDPEEVLEDATIVLSYPGAEKLARWMLAQLGIELNEQPPADVIRAAVDRALAQR